MVKRRSLSGWLICLLLGMSAAPVLADGQDKEILPQPKVMPQGAKPLEVAPAQVMPEPERIYSIDQDVPQTNGCCAKLTRLWQFITFRQPPRPRECQGCLGTHSANCTPPLYEYYSNRYPASSWSMVGK